MHHHGHFLVVIMLCSTVLLMVGLLVLQPRITGWASFSAQGGVIQRMDLIIAKSPLSWIGLYGNITNSSVTSSTLLSGQQVLAMDLYYDGSLTGTVIVASTVPDPDWSSVLPAPLSLVDSYLGLSPSHALSGTNTFMQKENFSINGHVLEVWSASVNSLSGSFVTGVLEQGGNLLFITRPESDGIGFAGSPVMYQMLLALPGNGSANFSFFVFRNDSLPAGSLLCNASFNLSSYLYTDDSSIMVSWDEIEGANTYEVLYINGPTHGLLNFSGASSVEVGSNTSWLDAGSSMERYYKVKAVNGGTSCLSNETAGKVVVTVHPDYNLVSNPFARSNTSVADSFRSIDGMYNTVLQYDNELKTYKFYIDAGSFIIKEFDTIEEGRGYWLKATQTRNLTFTGVVNTSLRQLVSADYNLVGAPVLDNSAGNESVSYVFSSIDGVYNTVLEFDNELKTYRFYIDAGSFIIKEFDTIEEGRGYWLKATGDAAWEFDQP